VYVSCELLTLLEMRSVVFNCNNNTNICNARSVSKNTESEAQAVAR